MENIDFEKFQLTIKKPIKPARYAKDLEHAAELSRDAIKHLEMEIWGFDPYMQKNFSQYPGNIAIEANRLLSGLLVESKKRVDF